MVNKYDNYELKKITSLENVPGTIKDGDGYIWDPSELPDKDFDDSKVPLNFRRLGIWMRSKMFGIEVRETVARLAEMFGLNFKELMESFESLDDRQETLETQTAQDVAQMKADKDAVIANATVDSEVILARDGKTTLGQRLDDITAQFGLVKNIDDFKIKDETLENDTALFQRAFNELKTNGTLVLNSEIYEVDTLFLKRASGFTIVGNNSTIVFNGEPVSTGHYLEGTLFWVEECQHITIKDVNLQGKMFDKLSKTNPPTTPIDSVYTDSDKHHCFHIIGSSHVVISDTKITDFVVSIYAGASSHVNLNDISIYDTFFGVQFYKISDSILFNVNIYDARYAFSTTSIPTEVTTIGARGTGILLDKVENVTVNKSRLERCATDSLRVQGGSKNVLVENSIAYQSRRHGFSVYHTENEVVFENCVTRNTGDYLFWFGTDNTDTFQRPVNKESGASFLVNGGNVATIENCRADELFYEEIPSHPNPEGYHNGVILNRMLVINGGSNVNVINSRFKGHTRLELFLMQGNNSLLSGNTFKGNSFYNGVVTSSNLVIDVVGNDNSFINNDIHGGMHGFFVRGFRNIIMDNRIMRSGSRNIYIFGGGQHYIDGNYMTNNGQSLPADGVTPALQVVNSVDVILGRNIGVDQRSEKKMEYVYYIGGGVQRLEVGTPVAIGGIPEINVFSRNVLKNSQVGKVAFQAQSQAESVAGLRNDFNLLLDKMRDSYLMN